MKQIIYLEAKPSIMYSQLKRHVTIIIHRNIRIAYWVVDKLKSDSVKVWISAT